MFAEIYPYLGLIRSRAAGRRCAPSACRCAVLSAGRPGARLLRTRPFPAPCSEHGSGRSAGCVFLGRVAQSPAWPHLGWRILVRVGGALGNGSAGLNAGKRRLWVRCASV